MTRNRSMSAKNILLQATMAVSLGLFTVGFAAASPTDDILAGYATEASALDSSFDGFSAERGRTLFVTEFGTGKEDTPACTTCHTNDPTQLGETRAGKSIDPMAASINLERYVELKQVEKWFGRNCKSVIGRECTPIEKGDFITFMLTL